MIIPIERPRVWVGLLDQVHAVLAHARVVGEHAELRIVQHVEPAFEILHAEDGVELLGENRQPPIRMETKDAAERGIGRSGDVHRVFSHEHAAIRRGANDRRMLDSRRLGDEFKAPAGRRLRQRGGKCPDC